MVTMIINRNIINELQEEITRPEINILLGPRQVGKTTLLKELQKKADRAGLKTAYFDLEQPDVSAYFNKPDKDIIDTIKSAGKVIFIDEFQYLRNASRMLKAVYDSGANIKFFCTGSSSLEIHKHLKESLAGRRFIFRVYPFQYGEFLSAGIKVSLNEYLTYGGMPGLLHCESTERKQKMLSELLSGYILKDVKSLIKEENVRAFNHLLYLLAEKQASLVSVNSLAREIILSPKAITRYMDILEQTYVLSRVHSYSNNLGNELKKSIKTYFYDAGIRNALLKDFSMPGSRSDKGSVWESFVFLRLQQLLSLNMEIKFWRTKDGAEVDFVVLKDRKPVPIEAKFTLSGLDIPSGLKRFVDRYPITEKAYVINQEISGDTKYCKCKICFVPAAEFVKDFKV